MFPLPKLLILLVASSDGIPVVALPAPTRVASSAASIFVGHTRAPSLSTVIANTGQPVPLYQPIRGSGTRSPQPEQSEHQQQQTVDPVPYDMFTEILGPTDDASGTVGVTKSTIASSQMNATVTLDAATSAETVSSTIRLVIMTTSTVGADATMESIATTMTTTTTESVEMECLDKRAATPKSHRYSDSGSRGHKSHDRCQIESSFASTSDLVWWEIIPSPPALLLWSQSMMVTIGSMYVFAKAVLGCILCRSQPRDSTDVETRAVTLEEKET